LTNEPENISKGISAIYVDVGTTNTRVWLMSGSEVLARAQSQVGVRDSDSAGSNATLRATLRELIAKVQDPLHHGANSNAPVCVVAAGMIGSAHGLSELPHVAAPAGVQELSAATAPFEFPDVTPLPFFIVPGVRSGSTGDTEPLDPLGGQTDVMRGEETLCVGLHALGLVNSPALVLTLGSHWKAIQLGAEGTILSSVTSLSGEMISAVQTGTILASSIGNEWPTKMAADWLDAGMAEQRRSGLPRALFCVRLLELSDEGTKAERFAYLLGSFIAAELDALVARGGTNDLAEILISGHAAIAGAWAYALGLANIPALVLSEQETEKAFLTGLDRILVGQILIGAISTSGATKRPAVNPESHWRINGRKAAT
jgi:2-dehydro-3-deoxygalactonokinase